MQAVGSESGSGEVADFQATASNTSSKAAAPASQADPQATSWAQRRSDTVIELTYRILLLVPLR
jgi:hypothetical protein